MGNNRLVESKFGVASRGKASLLTSQAGEKQTSENQPTLEDLELRGRERASSKKATEQSVCRVSERGKQPHSSED